MLVPAKRSSDPVLNEIINRHWPRMQAILTDDGIPAKYPPSVDFNKALALMGWYWEPYGSVIYVYPQTSSFFVVESRGRRTYKRIGELKTFLFRMGYEHE